MTSFLNKSEEPVYTLADGQPVHDPSTSLQIRSRLVIFSVNPFTNTANIVSQLWWWWTCSTTRHTVDRVGTQLYHDEVPTLILAQDSGSFLS